MPARIQIDNETNKLYVIKEGDFDPAHIAAITIMVTHILKDERFLEIALVKVDGDSCLTITGSPNSLLKVKRYLLQRINEDEANSLAQHSIKVIRTLLQ